MARQAVRESLVLLKNEKKPLPLSQAGRAHPRGRQERRRHRQPVRRLDHRLAGPERQRDHERHDHSRRHQKLAGSKTTKVTFSRRRHGRRRAPTSAWS